jgi:ABC-type nitrate/sulfonate/bicarbonate transport system substrate-binding protein
LCNPGKTAHFKPAAIFAAILLSVAVAFAQPPALTTVRVESLSGVPLPLTIGKTRGIFAKFGILVQNRMEPSSAMLRANLAAGKIDIGIASVDNGVGMRTINHADAIIVMGGSTADNQLIVQPYIHSIDQLRGRIAIVDAVNTAFAFQLEKILLLHGLRAGRDYQIVSIGTMPKRLQAMRENKQYAATMLGGEFTMRAERDGFRNLGSTRQIIGPYQGPGEIVLRQWARTHADTLERYLAAYIAAQRWMLAPAHKQQVLGVLTSDSHLSPAVASRIYAGMTSKTNSSYEPDARISIPGFENVLKLRAEIEGEWGGKPPSVYEFYDPTYYRKALAMLRQSK